MTHPFSTPDAPPDGLSWEDHVRSEIASHGPREAFRRLKAENDARILRPDLDHGGRVVAERTAIYTELVRQWAATQHAASGYDKPFAVVALGGTGRRELAPASDLDFALLFDDVLEGNPLLGELQRQLIHSGDFRAQHGFDFEALPFNLEDVLRLQGKQLNSFLDLSPVYDPSGLAGRFRERIQATYDPFEHFLHVRGFWLGKWEKAAIEVERLDGFDIKNDALRVFLAGVWTLAGTGFQHSHEIYASIDPRDLEAYRFLIRVRCFVHLRYPEPQRAHGAGNHPEDQLGFDDFTAFGRMLGPDADEWARFEFANQVRARLLAARRRVARFTKTVIDAELKQGREAGTGTGVVYGIGGLRRAAPATAATPHERSRAALSLVLASQRYGVPIDAAELQSTFLNAGDWMVPVPELAALFYEQRGSLERSMTFLSQIEGTENRLFPGYARFETSLDARVMAERKELRGALERRKTRFLEQRVEEGRQKLSQAVSPEKLTDVMREVDPSVEAALLDADHLAAVKLALKTKRLPLTPADLALRQDITRPLHERFSSGMSEIPLADYYLPYRIHAGFPDEAVRVAERLITHRRAFRERSESPNDDRQVEEFTALCGDEPFLRALFVFTFADRAEWESPRTEPARWFNIYELYAKARRRFRPGFASSDPLRMSGFPEEESDILADFGAAFWTSEYRQHAGAFASALRALAEDPEPGGSKVVLLPGGPSSIIGVAARDFRGLAACITGALWHAGINLRQAHLFSATRFGLALDFFHVMPGGAPVGGTLLRTLQAAIRHQRHIADEDEAFLPPLAGQTGILEWRPGQFCLRHEAVHEAAGLVYALAYKVFRHLRGNIFSLQAHATRGLAYVAVFHSLPPDLPLADAQAIVATAFAAPPAPREGEG